MIDTVIYSQVASVFPEPEQPFFFSVSVFNCPQAARMSLPLGHLTVTATPAAWTIFAKFWMVSVSDASKKVPGQGLKGLQEVRQTKLIGLHQIYERRKVPH